jgi:hypothetical protein
VDAAIDNLLEAASIIMGWPSKAEIPPKLFEYTMALNAMVSTLESTLRVVRAEKIEHQHQSLNHCLSAMKCLCDLAGNDETKLDKPFAIVRSLPDLFNAFISQGLFATAEKMWRSAYGKELTPEVVVAAMLNISSSVNPRSFAIFLKEAVIPSLSVNHEALPLLSAWTCQTADAYDDEDMLGIDSAIFLLEVSLFFLRVFEPSLFKRLLDIISCFTRLSFLLQTDLAWNSIRHLRPSHLFPQRGRPVLAEESRFRPAAPRWTLQIPGTIA